MQSIQQLPLVGMQSFYLHIKYGIGIQQDTIMVINMGSQCFFIFQFNKLTLFLESEAHPLDQLRAALTAHVAAVLRGELRHWLLDFGGSGEGGRS